MAGKDQARKRRKMQGFVTKGVCPTSRIAPEISPASANSARPRKQSAVPDAKTSWAGRGVATAVRRYQENDVIMLQGEPAHGLFYVQTGTVKLSVLSRQGNEATIALLGPGEFFGQTCILAHLVRATATALTDCCVLQVAQRNVLRVLHRTHPLVAALISSLVARNQRIQEDLADQLFNSAEKRLARTLLLLAGLDTSGRTGGVIPNVTQQILAEMVGVTRQRVNFFMNLFRKQGFIEYDHEIRVRESLRRVLLHE